MYTPVDFNTIHTTFEERFPDLNVFQGRVFNYVKLAQHANSFELTKATDKLLLTNELMPWWKYKTKQRLKSWLVRTKLPHVPRAEVILVEGSRVVDSPEGKIGAITGGLKDFEYSWWDIRGSIGHEADFSVDLGGNYTFPVEEGCREVYEDVLMVWTQVEAAFGHLPAFLNYFKSSLLVFFESYRKWNYLLRQAKAKRVFFICHYHNEGIAAACKLLGIELVELQHGLISKRDLYYVYPERYSGVYKRALFPDRLWVYGAYWKDLFLGSAESIEGKIDVVGDFRYEKLTPNLNLRENVVLLCAQKNLHEPYIAYIQYLKSEVLPKHPDWKLLVKMHPLEGQSGLYFNEQNGQVEVLPLQSSLSESLSRCRVQISIYSTTFFDGLGFSIANYALNDTGFSSDYVEDMIAQRVAVPLSKFDDPIQKFLEEGLPKQMISADEVYTRLKIEGLRG